MLCVSLCKKQAGAGNSECNILLNVGRQFALRFDFAACSFFGKEKKRIKLEHSAAQDEFSWMLSLITAN